MTPKPCSFCGKSDTLQVISGSEFNGDEENFYPHSDSYAVVCDASHPSGLGGCGASGGFNETKDEAIAVWNNRSTERKATRHRAPIDKGVAGC